MWQLLSGGRDLELRNTGGRAFRTPHLHMMWLCCATAASVNMLQHTGVSLAGMYSQLLLWRNGSTEHRPAYGTDGVRPFSASAPDTRALFATVVYASLVAAEASPKDAEIVRDLNRTYPSHVYYQQRQGPGQLSLYNVLKAFSLYDTKVRTSVV